MDGQISAQLQAMRATVDAIDGILGSLGSHCKFEGGIGALQQNLQELNRTRSAACAGLCILSACPQGRSKLSMWSMKQMSAQHTSSALGLHSFAATTNMQSGV